MLCSINVAKWVTKDNENVSLQYVLVLEHLSWLSTAFQVPEDPFFFCEDCFKSFNYKDGRIPIGKFKAYPYVDVNAI